MLAAWIVRLLLYAVLAYVILSIIKGIAGSGRRSAPPPPRPAPLDTLVKDDVCGTYLPRRDSIRAVIDGQERFFCSQDCRKKAKDGGGPSQ